MSLIPDQNTPTAHIKHEAVVNYAALLSHAFVSIKNMVPEMSDEIAKELAIASVEFGIGQLDDLMDG